MANSESRIRLTWGSVLFVLVLLVAFALRVWDVSSRAMHLDESTVAWFGWQLATGHGYAYDPVYHGPFQHEMLALIFLLFEPSQTSARLLAVVLGSGLVALPWMIRDFIGPRVALIACFLIAISPSFVYFARFERDDTYMEFFTFLLVVFALHFLRDRKPWQLYGLAIATAMAFATKESIYIVFFIFGTYLFFLSAGAWLRSRRPACLNVKGGRLPSAALVGFGAALAVAFVATPLTELFLPVPLIATVLLAAAVIGTGFTTMIYGPKADGMAAKSPLAEQNGDHNVPGHRLNVIARRQQKRRPRLSHSALDSLLSAHRQHWFNAATIAVGVVVLMYSTFGTDLNGLWDQGHPFFNTGHTCPYVLGFNLDACRKDIVGGLFYWLSQHKVARGGQPWYYYFLVYGLYEQLAIIFAVMAIVKTLVSKSISATVRITRVFIGYWAVLALIIYSWAGEKFPWLGIHPLLPITLLAAFGLNDVLVAATRHKDRRRSKTRIRRRFARASVAVAALLLILEIHNTVTLNYFNGANPVEMMVYVQSAPDTIVDANRIDALSNQATGGTTLHVTIDSLDAWPFAWYLRDMVNVGYPSGSQAVKPPYSTNPVIVLDQGDAQDLNPPASLSTNYTRTLRRLDWWFPEDYKAWTWPTLGKYAFDFSKWRAIWNWETVRTPFGPRDGTWYYLYIKKGYFPQF